MAKGKDQHVVPQGPGKWTVQGAGNTKPTKVTTTQKQAIEVAKDIATNQGSEVVIHGKDGQIREKNSYGNDPNPPKDQS